ncbi:hypothetical protein Tco_0892258 [Tanacetum coccineum]|uniref:Uncharacterized protein n=1 Tax=Tanacetum coccineum TaxID=301880 RepID=A0ABQ5C8K0_9ASTR
MAIMNSCNKHNMIACVEKTERNADFHEVIDLLTRCNVRMLNEVTYVEAKVAGKKILVSEASVRIDLMFNDEDGTNCFDNHVIWDTLRDIGYEGSLTLLSFSKPLFSPQWKYLVHTLLHCLSSKSSSWDQFGTNITSSLVGLATNQKFNFSKLIFDGMIRNLKDSKSFLMYPRFIQLFLNKQLEGITKPQTFLPTVVLPPKVFTFMSKCSPKFSGKLTPLTPHMLEVATVVRDAHSLHTEELDINTSSQHSDDSSAGEKEVSPRLMKVLLRIMKELLKLLKFIQDDTLIADLLVNISKNRRGAGITIPGNIPKQESPKSPTQILDPRDKGKGIIKEEHKNKKLTLQQLRAAETANNEEFARRVAAKWEEEEERKRLAGLERLQAKLEDNEMIAAEVQRTERENFTEEQKAKFLVETIAAQRRFRAEQQAALRRSKPPTIPQLRNQMMKYIRNVGGKAYKNLKNKSYEEIRDIYEKVKRINDKFVAIGSTEDEKAIKEMNVKAEEPSKKRKGTIRKMKSSRIIKKRKLQKSDDELKDFLKVVNFEDDCAQDVEVMEQHSVISRFSIVQSPEGEYIAVQRANGHIRAFNTLNEVLHILDRQDLYHLHRLVIEYYEHIPPTGLGLILHGDLTTMMETTEESDDELWRNQTEWEIISWRFYESTGVHILELENGTMIHMLVEQRYPLTRELMQRMLEHKLEVQKETEDALNVIRFVMKQKEELEREEE